MNDIIRQVTPSIDFLSYHPAISPNLFGRNIADGFTFWVVEMCKNGKPHYDSHEFSLYIGDEGWEKYRDLFDKEYENDNDTPETFRSIEISYELYFGEKWEFDHLEYGYDVTFYIFEGDVYGVSDKHIDMRNWGAYSGVSGKAKTFEEMVVQASSEVKSVFGDYQYNRDFILESENRHQENVEFMHLEDDGNSTSKFCVFNKDYVHVHNGLENIRWLKWFIKTDYAKENWECSFKDWNGIIKKLDNVPERRKKLLKPFEG